MTRLHMVMIGSLVVGAVFGPMLVSLLSIALYVVGGAASILFILHMLGGSNES